MRLSVYAHLDPGAKIAGKATTAEHRGDPYPVLDVGDFTFFPASVSQLDAIIDACETAKSELRAAVVKAWAEAHPEQARPLDHGGLCDGCQSTTDQLYAITTVGSSGEQDLAVCATCGSVEFVDELGHPTKLDPGELDDSDRRADLHDDGIDDPTPHCDGGDLPYRPTSTCAHCLRQIARSDFGDWRHEDTGGVLCYGRITIATPSTPVAA